MATKKLHLDARAAMSQHMDSSKKAAEDRFARASEITQAQPTGLSPVQEVVEARVPTVSGSRFSIDACVVGSIVRVPIALIDPNPVGPRQIYLDTEVDKISTTLTAGQDVAAHGYVEGGRIKLIDGGTRYRAARISDVGFLDVKIEKKPETDLALYLRARALNENRSDTTALDFAMSLRCLFDRGAVKSHREVVELVPGPDGAKLSESMVSMYMRISRMPEKIQRDMSRHEETNTFNALYAVSGLFGEGKDEEQADAAMAQAKEIIDEIVLRRLTSKQIAALVLARTNGPKSRQRSAITPLEFGRASPWKGQIKTLGSKGQIDLSLKGVSEGDLPAVRALLSQALADYLARNPPEGE